MFYVAKYNTSSGCEVRIYEDFDFGKTYSEMLDEAYGNSGIHAGYPYNSNLRLLYTTKPHNAQLNFYVKSLLNEHWIVIGTVDTLVEAEAIALMETL